MSGIQMALLARSSGPVVTTGSYVNVIKTSYQYFYGYDGATGGASFIDFGSISNSAFGAATIKAVYSASSPGSIGVNAGLALSYDVIFDGNRSAGFFNTLRVNGTLVSGTLSGPSYNAGNNETTFTITLGASVATLFGTTDGVLIPVALT